MKLYLLLILEISVMNTIQTVFKCCGCDGPSDYVNIAQMTSCQVPDSDPNQPDYFKEGCYNAIVVYINTHLPVLIGISVTLILFQLFCLIVSIKSCSVIRHEVYEDI